MEGNLKSCENCGKRLTKTTYYRSHYNARCKGEKKIILPSQQKRREYKVEAQQQNHSLATENK